MALAPFPDDGAYLRAELARLDLLLRRHLDEWWDERGKALDEFRGLYVSDAEVDLLLAPSASPHGTDETDGSDSPTTSALDDPIAATARTIRTRRRLTVETGRQLRFDVVVDRFGLDACHRDVLLFCLAPELDRKYETIYAYLQDDATLRRPTVDLALRALYRTDTDRLAARALFARRSPLVRHGLVRRVDGEDTSLLATRLRVDDRIVEFLVGADDPVDGETTAADTDAGVTPGRTAVAVPDCLADVATVTRPTRRFTDLPVEEPLRASLRGIVERRTAQDGAAESARDRSAAPPMVVVTGPYGSAKTAMVEAACAKLEAAVLTIDGAALVAEATDEDLLGLALREARLRELALHVRDVPSQSGAGVDEARVPLVERLDAFEGAVFLTGETFSRRLQTQVTGHDLAVLEIPTPPYERRLACWRAVEGLPADVDPAALASTFTLTPGQIDDAVAAARVAVATADPPRLTVDAIYRACRAQTGEGLVELARHVEPGYTWDDIVLPADKLAHLREIADHVRQHGRVYAEWGFADAFSLGNGIVVLFTGAPGTGKTMAADVIANDVGLDLYKIDLSRIVSKYIGETEKNLGRVFDEAAACNAILLFDEADALFGKRSDVRDAHDRYANVEVNYLLQRIEEHDGPVVLTTNFDQNIDDAFRRRIHHCVDFPLPDRDARERIWRSIFPDRTPVGDLDYAFVREFAFTGGHIKNVALTAAFMAAADGGVVEMPHVVRATARELQKTGTVVGPDMFGPYGEVVSP